MNRVCIGFGAVNALAALVSFGFYAHDAHEHDLVIGGLNLAVAIFCAAAYHETRTWGDN